MTDASFLPDRADGSGHETPAPLPILRLLPAELLPGDEIKVMGEWQRVLTTPEGKGSAQAVGMEGVNAPYVAYLDADRQVTVRRPLAPWPDATLTQVRSDERGWLGQIKNRKW